MHKFDYVFSAVGMFALGPARNLALEESYLVAAKDIFPKAVAKLRKVCTNESFEAMVSILYNAYTEEKNGHYFKQHDRLGFDSIYSDSGGLQIVTVGEEITDDLRRKMYSNQLPSDFGMAFDTIPLRTIRQGPSSRRERVNYDNKIFETAKFEAAANKTGADLREQLDYYIANKTNTKAVMIIQGNTTDDMVYFYDRICAHLDPHHYDHIAGLAMADTCIGNGTLQSIEMLEGYNKIRQKCDVRMASHLHLLGVGSVARLTPVVYLMKSGFIPSDVRVSFDSTSFSSSYFFGKFLGPDGKLFFTGKTRTRDVEEFFRKNFAFYREELEPYISEQKFVDYFSDNAASLTKTLHNDHSMLPISAIGISLVVMRQLTNLMGALAATAKDSQWDVSPMGGLQYVKNIDDLHHWTKHNARYIDSTRIRREEEVSTLEAFMAA